MKNCLRTSAHTNSCSIPFTLSSCTLEQGTRGPVCSWQINSFHWLAGPEPEISFGVHTKQNDIATRLLLRYLSSSFILKLAMSATCNPENQMYCIMFQASVVIHTTVWVDQCMANSFQLASAGNQTHDCSSTSLTDCSINCHPITCL